MALPKNNTSGVPTTDYAGPGAGMRIMKSDDPIAAICPHILREVSLEKGEAKFNCLVCGERGAADLDLTSTNLYG